ncbi:MAG: electron transport complex subunit RsxC [Gammaproteobacteria bacterium]|nr:MAG: electron transport complex subunit RsxC [Gammaproteobacteria bacterium]
MPDSIIKKLYKFHGGVHMADKKYLSNNQGIIDMPLSKKFIIPLIQHRGVIAKATVKIGDKVQKYQIIARTFGKLGAVIHAPTSGIITDLKQHRIAHPGNIQESCLILEADGKDKAIKNDKPINTDLTNKEKIIKHLKHMGLVGLGGAVFPTYFKLQGSVENPIKTLIINAVECEPYITCDDMLMRQSSDEIIAGTMFMQKLIGAKECIIAVEDNKPEAINSLHHSKNKTEYSNIQIVAIPTIYPSGGEKQLIKVLKNKEIPVGKIPADLGFVCQNVSTVYAFWQAIYKNIPLVQRVVTITGEAVKKPANLIVRFGTPIKEVLKFCGALLKDETTMGGPMMGFVVRDKSTPVTKATNCLLVRHKKPEKIIESCIRCGKCQDVCPMNLLPQQLYWAARDKSLNLLEKYDLLNCIECACCDYVCPSNISLVAYFKFGKGIWQKDKIDRKKAEHAKNRHDFKEQRIIAAKAKRAALLAEKKEKLKLKNKLGTGQAVLDAMARVEQKKLQESKK